jgi:hypothetical protein
MTLLHISKRRFYNNTLSIANTTLWLIASKIKKIHKHSSSMAPRSVRFGVRSRKLSNIGQSWDGLPKMLLTLSCWSHLHLQSIAPTNPHWARVVGESPFSLCAIHKEGLCPSSGDTNRLMMVMT